MVTDPRSVLLGEVVEAFALRPEVEAIYCFGSEAEGHVDAYSDIDLVVCSADLAETQRGYLQSLGAISPVGGCIYHVCEDWQLAQSLLLRNRSPYHKIDLTIADRVERRRGSARFAACGAGSGRRRGLGLASASPASRTRWRTGATSSCSLSRASPSAYSEPIVPCTDGGLALRRCSR